MTERNYLLKVLGVSGLPKLATFVLSLTTIPIVLRSVGALEYGRFLYVAAGLGICEVLIDFGISSATGRRMAELRALRPSALRSEFAAWARLQGAFLIGGFLPMLAAAYWMIGGERSSDSTSLLLVVAATLGLNVVLNFLRPCLQSMLAFKSLALLDTFESVARSCTLLAAAALLPSSMGLAIAGLSTSVAAAALAVALTWLRLREPDAETPAAATGWRPPRTAERMRDALSFLWLRFSTRLFQELPSLMIGRTLGPELVGIIGAFRRIVEILSTPYLVIGNALMVRVNEIHRNGDLAMKALWEAALRIVSTVVFVTALCFLSADLLANALLPAVEAAPAAFRLLAPLVLFASLIGTVAPISDYLGALGRRNVILSTMALAQVPVLWLAITLWRETGALLASVTTYGALAVAYTALAHRTFFAGREPVARREVVTFVFACIAALVVTTVAGAWLQAAGDGASVQAALQIAAFCALVALALSASRGCLRYYFRRDFLDFTR